MMMAIDAIVKRIKSRANQELFGITDHRGLSLQEAGGAEAGGAETGDAAGAGGPPA
jgi:hypothetical protein